MAPVGGAEMVEVEPSILATAAVAGADEHLTICAISWHARYDPIVDGRRLSELTRDIHWRGSSECRSCAPERSAGHRSKLPL
jgi:hypothetical protein